MTYTGNDLTIVICAYKECPSLEDCIRHIKEQTVQTKLKIATSTPNEYINNLAERYDIEVCVNPVGGHVKDYNFAMHQITTKLGMLAHQDDLLDSAFVEKNLKQINKAQNPILAFSNYLEMHNDVIDTRPSMMIRIKRFLTWPVRIPGFRGTVFAKRLLQCIGNPITHPTVVCVMEQMPEVCFDEHFRASMDWDLWERLSKKRGEFVYVKDVLLYHRMNKENATAKLLENTNLRYQEEFEIMNRFWPRWITKLIMTFYSKSSKFY